MFGNSSRDEDNRLHEAWVDASTPFNNLRAANTARQAEWDPSGHTGDLDWRMNELAGEIGEVCNVLKKLHRERCGMPGSRTTVVQLAEELADVLICLDLFEMDAGLVNDLPGHLRKKTFSSYAALTRIGMRMFALGGLIFSTDYRALDTFERRAARDTLRGVINALAEQEGIDIGAAVVAKFNATSEKLGFKTRLTDYQR